MGGLAGGMDSFYVEFHSGVCVRLLTRPTTFRRR